MNVGKIMVLVGLAVITSSYGYSVYNSQYKIAITATGNVYKVTKQGLILKIKYNIKNPTGITLKMSPPLIVITGDSTQLATSNMQIIDIPESARDNSGKIILHATQETGNIEAEITVPWVNLAEFAPSIVTRYLKPNPDPKKKVEKIQVTINVYSQIYTLAGRIPYQQESKMFL